MSNRKEIHDRVLNAASKEELAAAYAEWAEAYDRDLLDEMGYVAHVTASKLLQDHLDSKEAQILDAGCGTGLVGEFLHQNGYHNLEGLDYSRHMLEKAREKDLYKRLIQGDLTGSLDIADNRYDAVISVGAFTCGHVGPAAFAELVRITRPDGYICFTVREQAWEEDSYRAELDRLENQGAWEQQAEHTADYITEEGSSCQVCLYQVTI